MLDELALFLESQGIGTVGVDIFRHRLPENPDKAMVLTPYGGSLGPRVHDEASTAFRIDRFQARFRGHNRAAATSFANAAYDVLWLNNAILGTRIVVKSEPLQPPFDMPEDERNRAIVIFNLETWSI